VRKVLFTALVAACLAGGCGKSPPTTAGGKPVAHWVGALRDPDPRVRKKAARKLGNVGPSDPAALPALVGALKDADPGVRRESVLALLKFGPAGGEAGPALEEAGQKDPDPTVRAYAVRALEKLRGAR